jgi:ribosomal protein S18
MSTKVTSNISFGVPMPSSLHNSAYLPQSSSRNRTPAIKVSQNRPHRQSINIPTPKQSQPRTPLADISIQSNRANYRNGQWKKSPNPPIHPSQVWHRAPRITTGTGKSKKKRNQRRSAAHRQSQGEAKANFKKGVSELLPSLVPSLERLLKKSTTATDDDDQRDITEAIHVTVQQIMEAQCEEEAVVTKLLEAWCSGAVGYVPAEKPDGAVRLYGENVNSLCWFDRQKNKTPKILKMLCRYDPDIFQMLETQVNFDSDQCKPSDEKLIDKIGVMGEIVKSLRPVICTAEIDVLREARLK